MFHVICFRISNGGIYNFCKIKNTLIVSSICKLGVNILAINFSFLFGQDCQHSHIRQSNIKKLLLESTLLTSLFINYILNVWQDLRQGCSGKFVLWMAEKFAYFPECWIFLFLGIHFCQKLHYGIFNPKLLFRSRVPKASIS